MARLSVPKETKITIANADTGAAYRASVEEVIGQRQVFNGWGEQRTVNIRPADKQEPMYMMAATSGEPMLFGESHTLLCRNAGSARWHRKAIGDIIDMVIVKLPQRKIQPIETIVFDHYDADDKGLFLKPERAADMLRLMLKASYSGLTVHRNKTELRIDLDKARPACFGNKLIMGSFQQDLEAALDSLAGSGVLTPCEPFTEAYIGKVRTTGIIFEGNSVFTETPLLPPKKLNKPGDVYWIDTQDDTPVELNWFQS